MERGLGARMWMMEPGHDARARAFEARDPAWARWHAQPWRRQLHQAHHSQRRLERKALVARLARESLTPAGELARLARTIEVDTSPEHLTIHQVVCFVDSLIERLASARPDELIAITFLQRNAVGLANRMIDWVNAGRM